MGLGDDLMAHSRARVERGERVLVTTLTKRMAEDLADYLKELGIKVHYLHSEVETFERVEILRDLRLGAYDVVVGINLLREGLDLPEVSLVAILDADKEGFLRSETSLIQTIGRTARNVNATVFLYADKITPSMKKAIDETARRRTIQLAYNQQHGITPQTIRKEIQKGLSDELAARKRAREAILLDETEFDQTEMLAELERQMFEAAEKLDFERAAMLRDRIQEIKGMPAIQNSSAAPAAQDNSSRKNRSMKTRKR
jgi:excinuclease ABC subunit B